MSDADHKFNEEPSGRLSSHHREQSMCSAQTDARFGSLSRLTKQKDRLSAVSPKINFNFRLPSECCGFPFPAPTIEAEDAGAARKKWKRGRNWRRCGAATISDRHRLNAHRIKGKISIALIEEHARYVADAQGRRTNNNRPGGDVIQSASLKSHISPIREHVESEAANRKVESSYELRAVGTVKCNVRADSAVDDQKTGSRKLHSSGVRNGSHRQSVCRHRHGVCRRATDNRCADCQRTCNF